ncbi:MAG: TolB family protein [Chloroflexota bacterium]
MMASVRFPSKLLLILVVLLIQGCGATSSPAELPVIPTGTKSKAPTAAPSRVPPPSAINTPTPNFAATLHVVATAQVDAILSTVQPVVLKQYPSSDGKWRVDVIRYDCTNFPGMVDAVAYEQLKLINIAEGTEKIIEDELQNCGGIGSYGFKGLYWSPSSRYFYYTDWREGYPEGCGTYLVPFIYRLDVSSQASVPVGGGHLSPDGTKLAMWDGDDIVIWDLDRGEIGRVRSLVPDFFAGEIAWSPDSQSLVYLQAEFDCAPHYGETYVVRLDFDKNSQTLLIKYPPPGLGGVDWFTPGQITLRDGDGNYWTYDFSTRDTTFLGRTPFTPTPVPPGVFALVFYPPLVVNYDPSEWKDESRYADNKSMTNFLQSRRLSTCTIGVQGPTDFNGPQPQFIPALLGDIRYSMIFWGETTPSVISAWYIEDQSLTDYNYAAGLPIFAVQASVSEWDACKALAEKVLSTLRVP